jgi:hypothetical protein
MDEILINTSTLGSQTQPAITGFRGTQFVAAWEDLNDGNIKGQMLSPEGTKTGNEFLVNVPDKPNTKRQRPAIVETPLGFAVAWNEQLPGGVPQLKLRVFDGDTLSGPEIQVSSAPVEPLTRPAMARLGDGGFVTVWADARADERIRAQRFGLEGEKAGPEFRANTVAGLHRIPMAAALTNGTIVVGWRARISGPLLVHFQIFDASGSPVGSERTTNIDLTHAAMAPLDSGRFVITHIRQPGDGETGFDTFVPEASVFEASGASAGIRFSATTGRIQTSWPAIVPLSGGRFVLGWTETNVDAPAAGTNVMAKLFSVQGAIGKAVRVNTSTGHERFSLSIAATSGPDGETLFAVWNEDNPGGGNASGRAVRGRPLPIPAGGF